MFVQANTIKATKVYFKTKLADFFSDSEIKSIYQFAFLKRLNLSPTDLLLADENRVSESDLLYFRSIVKRLLAHEPLQYILGETEFYGLSIKCDERALIPRPESEELVDWIVNAHANQGLTIMDLCTGTGCIALGVKNNLKAASVYAVDESDKALALASENAKNLKLDINVQRLDVLSEPSTWGFSLEMFDLWISNPPYIPTEEKKSMAQHVLDFEPHMALFVPDKSPLIFYEKIMQSGLIYLKKGGYLYFELHENYATETLELMEFMGYQSCEIKLDLQGKKRMLKGKKAE